MLERFVEFATPALGGSSCPIIALPSKIRCAHFTRVFRKKIDVDTQPLKQPNLATAVSVIWLRFSIVIAIPSGKGLRSLATPRLSTRAGFDVQEGVASPAMT